jgi:hypothetical protein
MRKTVLTLAVIGLVVPAAARAQGGDADKKVAGGGSLPAGWMMRVDPKDKGKPAEPKMATMGKGLHVSSGSAAIYWNPADMATAPYKVEATFTQTKSPGHREAYGILFGGHDLKDSSERYMYFVIGGTGEYTVKHTANDKSIHVIQDWTANPAIKKQDEAGKSTNTLSVTVGKDKVSYAVNGTEVYSTPTSAIMGGANGQVGLRVNHNLDMHIEGFKVTATK